MKEIIQLTSNNNTLSRFFSGEDDSLRHLFAVQRPAYEIGLFKCYRPFERTDVGVLPIAPEFHF
jgi:hypothetical protein